MEYRKSDIDGTIVRDFAERTLHNLRFIEKQYKLFLKGKQPTEVYEVTQLINSMLGLLIFPKETFWDHLKPIELKDIPKCPFKDHQNAPNLRELVRLLRNSFSHFNLEIKGDDKGCIYAIEMFNVNQRGQKTWCDTVTVFKLRSFVEWFIEGIIDSSLLDTPIKDIKVA